MTDPIRNKLAEALRECADDLEAELNARYPKPLRKYPREGEYYRRDMAAVYKARELLAAHDAAQGRASGAEAGTAESIHAQLSQAGRAGEDARDAARYRWLVGHAESIRGLRIDWYTAVRSAWGVRDETLDAAIDAAIAQSIAQHEAKKEGES